MGLEYKSQLCAYSAYSPVLALICKKPLQRIESLTSIHLLKKDQNQNNEVHKDDFSGSVNFVWGDSGIKWKKNKIGMETWKWLVWVIAQATQPLTADGQNEKGFTQHILCFSVK